MENFEKIPNIDINEISDKENEIYRQYLENVKKIFDKRIPWLDNIDNIPGHLSAVQIDGQLAGGVLQFDQAPESAEILEQKEKLLGPGGVFQSCLYIDQKLRGQGLAEKLLDKKFEDIFAVGEYAWGIVEGPELLHYYYKRFAAETFPLSENTYFIKITANKYHQLKHGKDL